MKPHHDFHNYRTVAEYDAEAAEFIMQRIAITGFERREQNKAQDATNDTTSSVPSEQDLASVK